MKPHSWLAFLASFVPSGAIGFARSRSSLVYKTSGDILGRLWRRTPERHERLVSPVWTAENRGTIVASMSKVESDGGSKIAAGYFPVRQTRRSAAQPLPAFNTRLEMMLQDSTII